MIQLNLLPEVKIAYLRAQQTKRFFVFTSMIVGGGAIAVVALMALFVYGVQGRHSANLDANIKSNLANLQGKENLSQILTVQNQLDTLEGLHDQKPIVSRLFDYFIVLIPDEVSLNDVELQFTDAGDVVIEMNGTGDEFKSINQFADSLKNAQYTSVETTAPESAFRSVTLDTIGRSDENTIFTIQAEVEPRIFDARETDITLSVPDIISSPSVTERPGQLFEQQQEEGQ